jgi:hypothetical protein
MKKPVFKIWNLPDTSKSGARMICGRLKRAVIGLNLPQISEENELIVIPPMENLECYGDDTMVVEVTGIGPQNVVEVRSAVVEAMKKWAKVKDVQCSFFMTL